MKSGMWHGKWSTLVKRKLKPRVNICRSEGRGRGSMEPTKTHGSTWPQQELIQPAGGCPSGPRPVDLMLGGYEGANPHADQRMADEAVDNATADTQSPGVFASTLGDTEKPRYFAYNSEDSGSDTDTSGEISFLECSDRTLRSRRGRKRPYRDHGSDSESYGDSCGESDGSYICNSGIQRSPSTDNSGKNVCMENSGKIGDSSIKIEKNSEAIERSSQLTRLDAFNLLVKLAKAEHKNFRPFDIDISIRTAVIINALKPLLIPTLTEDDNTKIKKVVATVLNKCEGFYKKCKGHMHYFTKKHAAWLNKPLIEDLPASVALYRAPPTEHDSVACKVENEPLKVKELSIRQELRRRKKLQAILEEEQQNRLIKVFTQTVKVNGETLPKSAAKDLEKIIHTCLETPTKATEILKKIKEPPPRPFTPEEALDLMIDRKLSVATYRWLQQDSKSRGFNVFPPYHKIAEVKMARYNTAVETDVQTKREESNRQQDLLSEIEY